MKKRPQTAETNRPGHTEPEGRGTDAGREGSVNGFSDGEPQKYSRSGPPPASKCRLGLPQASNWEEEEEEEEEEEDEEEEES
ncbi:unnamed protein product [Lota lota]